MPEANMMNDASADLLSPDPGTRAGALIERAISNVQAGDHRSAIADLEEAERVAVEAGLHELVIAVRINQGYAHSMNGEGETAIDLYTEAASRAREAEDVVRLQLALANLTAELGALGRHAEAIATLDEYLALLDEDQLEERVRALTNRGMLHLETGDTDAALSNLEQAEQIAIDANADYLTYLAQMNMGYAYNRNEDPHSALMLFDRASMIARQLDDKELLRDALLNLAQTNHSVGHSHLARVQFVEVELLCRQTEEMELLAHTLYWYGSTLRALGRTQEALAKWDEAASIRRELGHEGHLADCLLMMADVHRRRSEHEKAHPLYSEAEEIYARLGIEGVLGSTIYWHGMSLWSGGRPEEALERADEALRVAVEESDDEFECRAHGLRAMVLADLERLPEAADELDVAEARCMESGFPNLAVWMLARRAYLYAREGRAPEEVTQELSRAFSYAADHEQIDAATSAIRRVSSLISSRCGEEYHEPVRNLKDALLSTPVDPITGEGMPDLPFLSPTPEAPPADAEITSESETGPGDGDSDE
jgi:tetratricopeptide (TPR) repeat protein